MKHKFGQKSGKLVAFASREELEFQRAKDLRRMTGFDSVSIGKIPFNGLGIEDSDGNTVGSFDETSDIFILEDDYEDYLIRRGISEDPKEYIERLIEEEIRKDKESFLDNASGGLAGYMAKIGLVPPVFVNKQLEDLNDEYYTSQENAWREPREVVLEALKLIEEHPYGVDLDALGGTFANEIRSRLRETYGPDYESELGFY